MKEDADPVWQMFRDVCDPLAFAVTASRYAEGNMPIEYANRAFLDLTGYVADDVLGHDCRFLQGPDTRENDRRALRDGLRVRDYSATCILNYRKDGTAFSNLVVIETIQTQMAGGIVIGCQYEIDPEPDPTDLRSQFDRTDGLLRSVAIRVGRQMRDTYVMRASALTSTMRVRMVMDWIRKQA